MIRITNPDDIDAIKSPISSDKVPIGTTFIASFSDNKPALYLKTYMSIVNLQNSLKTYTNTTLWLENYREVELIVTIKE